MDTTNQLYERDATGWRRGLYEDLKRTFRAPIVNWIFRTTVANEPAFVRHAWAQVKPAFETAAFARLTIEYRDAVLSSLEADHDLPAYRFADLDLDPVAYAELRGQLETYDVVAPRLAVFFELVDRGLHEDPIGTDPTDERAATAPFPDWLDADRGRPPTMIDVADVPDVLTDVVSDVQSFHGLEEGLPSIYRTLAQWPAYLEPMWADLEGPLHSDAFSRGVADARAAVTEYVDSLYYTPQLGPDALSARGIDDDAISQLQDLFREFNRGAIETVVPALPAYAATLGVDGRRSLP